MPSCIAKAAEQGHDAIAHHPADRPLEAVDRADHRSDGRLQQRPGLFRIKILDQLGRSDDVGE
jgi:hypothetical protein